MDAFWLSLALVFIAELGDKTQLVALCLACRYNAKVVLAGVLAATLVVHIISVLLGGGLGKLLPEHWIQLIAGLAFIGFGLWTLRGDSLDDDDKTIKDARSPFWIVSITFFIAELGDKTMLSTVSLATNNPMIPVWLGSSIGMVLSDGLAIIVGQALGKNLPERAIKIGAACIFFSFGLYKMYLGATNLPYYSWIFSAIIIAGLLIIFFRAQKAEKQEKIFKGCPLPAADDNESAG
ncbi:MAG: TMEM165/GDT1 family protein [Armatimonadota bacterium]